MSSPVTEYHEEEALGKAYDSRLMRRLIRYAKPYRLLVAASLSLLAVEGVLQLVGPLLTQRVIDVALPARDIAAAAQMAALFAGALPLSFLASYGETLLTSLLGQKVMRDLRHELFAHLQELPVAFFDRNPVGRLITRVTSDVESLNELFTAGVVSGMGDLFTLVAISVLMIITDWRLALASFAVIPFVWMTSSVFQRSVRAAYREIRTRLARINAYLQEHITGMRIVQLFGRERDEAARFDALNRDHLDAHLKSIRIYALYFPAIEILTTVALASLIVAGARRVEVGALTVGTVAAFLQLVRRFFEPLQDLSDKYNMLQKAMAASERVFRLLDTPEGPGSGKREAPSSRIPLPSSGKVNGVDIREMSVFALRSLIGYVQQDIFLFAADIAGNIGLSHALSDEDVVRAAARVGADRIIRRLPKGYAHVLGERGASISVGE